MTVVSQALLLVVGVKDPTSDIGWPLPNYCSKFLQVDPPSWLIDQPGMGVSHQPNAQSFMKCFV